MTNIPAGNTAIITGAGTAGGACNPPPAPNDRATRGLQNLADSTALPAAGAQPAPDTAPHCLGRHLPVRSGAALGARSHPPRARVLFSDDSAGAPTRRKTGRGVA